MAYNNSLPLVSTITCRDAAYSSGNVIGGLKTIPLTISPTLIVGVTVAINEASIHAPGTLYLYNASPTAFADGAAFAPVAADNAKRLAPLLLPTAVAINSLDTHDLRYGTGGTMPLLPVQTVDGNLYFYYVTSGTPDFTGEAQTITVTFWQMGGA